MTFIKGQFAWNRGLKLPPSNNKKTGFCAKVVCEFCGSEFTKANFKRHRDACKGNPKNVYEKWHNCKNNNCNKLFSKNQDCCSRACSYEYRKIELYVHKCVECGIEYTSKLNKSARKTCSRECLVKLISKNSTNNVNCGARAGYKNTKSKRIYHRDILLDSNWELQIAIWLDENGIEWIRDRKLFFRWVDVDGKKRRYTPDFYLPKLEIYLDTKNSYLMRLDRDKMNQVRSEHGIILIAGAVKYVKGRVKRKIFQQTFADINLIS